VFVADRLVYLDLHKTGCTHIRRLLAGVTSGQRIGKHNRITEDLLGRYVLGSIRNPWDWYVSLWAYGVGGRGAIRARVVTRTDLSYYHRQLPKEMGKNWLTTREALLSAIHDAIKPVARWRETYGDAEDVERFRSWLSLLFSPDRRYDLGEGFGLSPLSRHAGLLTYRYLKLYSRAITGLYSDRRLRTCGGVREFNEEHNVLDGVIRMESLEEDFIRAMAQAGYRLTPEQEAAVWSAGGHKTNASDRRPASYYYDDETVALVASRERLIIETYGYLPPG